MSIGGKAIYGGVHGRPAPLLVFRRVGERDGFVVCIVLFGGIMTLAGIGEAECDMTLYMASDGFWCRPICIRTQDSMTLSIVCECNQ